MGRKDLHFGIGLLATALFSGTCAAQSFVRFPVDLGWTPPSTSPSTKPPAIGPSNPGTWVDPERDYPPQALRQGHEGTTGLAYAVETDGRTSDCRITATSGDDDLDQRSCELITARALYIPAKDADGRPVRSYSTLRITWRTNASKPPEFVSRVDAVLRDDGSLAACSYDLGSGTLSRSAGCSLPVPGRNTLALMHEAAGPGDLHILFEAGQATSEKTMDSRLAERPGWRQVYIAAIWRDVDENGVVTGCSVIALKWAAEGFDACKGPFAQYVRTVGPSGRYVKARVGTSVVYSVRMPGGSAR